MAHETAPGIDAADASCTIEPAYRTEAGIGRSTMTERELLQIGFRYALSLQPVREDAEDLVQEACCRLYRKSGKIVNKAIFSNNDPKFIHRSISAGKTGEI